MAASAITTTAQQPSARSSSTRSAYHPRVGAHYDGVAGQWVHDEYVGILIPKPTTGTVLTEENYTLELTVENRTSMELGIMKIEVEEYNHNAAQVFALDNDRVHTATQDVPTFLTANAKTTISITGNQILPKIAVFRLFHTRSEQPSTFEIDLGGIRMAMP